MTLPEVLGAAAVMLGLWAYFFYFIDIFKGKTRPHIFSWFIWALLTIIAWYGQYVENAGPGAWVTLITAIFCIIIAAISLKHGERNITRSDWVSFIVALSAIPVWMVTKDPLPAVIIVTVIDALSCYPTMRKSWHRPQEETAATFLLNGIKFVLSLAAMRELNWVTALYPASLVFLNFMIVGIIVLRRRQLGAA